MIRIEHLVKTFKGSDKPVVNDLNIHIEEGEICVLVGASGCGKTTTMRMINRLTPITAGKIFVGGKDIMTLSPIELRRNIGYVIQETGLFPHYSIEKNIATVPIEKKWDKKRIADRVEEMMRLVDLDPAIYAKKKPSALSGGQKQRVGVARALAGDPPIMLMDEPFGALDPITRGRLQNEFLTNIQAKLKKTIVFVTHDIDEAVKMGDKIAVMQDGKLAQFGTPHEILTQPANEFVENLVGKNRIIKSLSLISCCDSFPSAPFFQITEVEMIMRAIETAAAVQIGITDDEGRPIGYIDITKKRPAGPADISNCIVPTKAFVTERHTLYDAVSILFSLGQRAIFSVDENHKACRLIGISELLNLVNNDAKK